jgi:hypothetical protein
MPARTQTLKKPAKLETGVPPYPASWVDQLFAWIERLPFPSWLFYLVIVLTIALLGHIVRWLDGSLSPGSFQIARLAEALVPVWFLALIQYLNSASRRALATFRPALQASDQEYTRLEYILTTISRRAGILAVLVGTLLGISTVYSGPAAWGLSANTSIGTTALVVLLASAVNVGALLWLIHTIRQLRTVDRIHRMATNLSLFHREPHYAFSSLTLRTAIGALLIIYYYFFLAFYLDVWGQQANLTAIDAAGIGLTIATALAAFILPLSSMHRRLVEEKGRLVAEADERYSAIVDRFNREFDRARFKDLESTSRAIASLTSQRDALARITTWPWRPETLRSLLSTMALPVLLYVANRLVGRFLGV